MSLIDVNVVVRPNAAVAANFLSEKSFGSADAEQNTDVDQSTQEALREGGRCG